MPNAVYFFADNLKYLIADRIDLSVAQNEGHFMANFLGDSATSLQELVCNVGVSPPFKKLVRRRCSARVRPAN